MIQTGGSEDNGTRIGLVMYGGEPVMTRPNQGRTKTTVYLGEEDLLRIRRLQEQHGDRTQASAIRRALKIATTPLPETTEIGVRILHWAESLQ